ncbi:hypothetical protein quinque_002174 [Culex quinquefasciatus]
MAVLKRPTLLISYAGWLHLLILCGCYWHASNANTVPLAGPTGGNSSENQLQLHNESTPSSSNGGKRTCSTVHPIFEQRGFNVANWPVDPVTANPSPFRHLLTLPHCALQTPRCVRFAYRSASPTLGAGSPCDPHATRSVPYGDRHARRSQLYTVPVWELPVATPPFCSEEHPCRDHNRHRICQPL